MNKEVKIEVITDYDPSAFVIPYFRFRELHCRECYKEGGKYLVIDENFLFHLSLFRKSLNLPIAILSATRCNFHNEKVKGAKNSGHITGQAIDFFVPHFSAKEIYLRIEHLSFFSGVGIYEEEEIPFLHVDILPRIQRWTRKEGKYIYLFVT